MSDRLFSQLSCVLFTVAIICFSVLQFSLSSRRVPKIEDGSDIQARSLTLEGEEGQGSVRIKVTPFGPSICLAGPSGERIVISALGDGMNHTVWLYRDGQKSSEVSLGIEADGTGVVNFATLGGQVRSLSLKKLADLPPDRFGELLK